MLARCAAIVENGDAPSVIDAIMDAKARGLPGNVEPVVSSAAPITDDGYFLAAYHSVRGAAGKSLQLTYSSRHLQAKLPVRIVWKDEKNDIALIHADLPTPHHFRWSPAGVTIPAGTTVYHGGHASGSREQAGKILEAVRPEQVWSAATVIYHSAPITFGDSGGAVVDLEGRLLGINTRVLSSNPEDLSSFVKSAAVRPNVSLLEKIIAQDRSVHEPQLE